ncbi:MAG: hypothetical protein LBL99_04715 [Holosporaceae bacterium]|jgi:putative ABC transport system permease protein|nr:hypothetical protein [Holosporaceae bacterium]
MLSLQEFVAAAEIGLIYGMLAIGVYLTFRTLNFPDMTCDGSFAFGAAVSSVAIKSGGDPWTAAILAAIAGGLAGFATGILTVRFKIEDLLSGILVAFALYSINLRIMGNSPSVSLANEATMFGGDALLKIAIAVFILAAAVAYVLNADWGLGFRAVGQNKRFAAACGIDANAAIIAGLIASNALIGACGATFSQYQGFCDVSQGTGSLVIGLASVIIGETILKTGSSLKNVAWSVFACVLGSTAYRIFLAFAIRSDAFGLKTQDLNLITALIIITITAKRRKNA